MDRRSADQAVGRYEEGRGSVLLSLCLRVFVVNNCLLVRRGISVPTLE
jgi:hypothetical protein